jgi:bacterial/archaeal transporter family-2 protein
VSKELAVLVTVAAGGLVAAQAPVNNVLSDRVGTWGAVSVNFIVGTVFVLALAFAFGGGFSGNEDAATPALGYWVFGGFAGAAIVATTLVAVRELGAGGVTVAVIAGQLTLSVVLDRLGVLGLEQRAVTWEKVLGIAFLIAGTVLVVRD